MAPGLRSLALGLAGLVLPGLAALATGACGAPGPRAFPPPDPIEATFVPAFDALTAAVDARDDELARRILARIQARGPDAPTTRRAEAFERILDGRALTAELDLRLVHEPAAQEGVIAVIFEARHGLDEQLRVRTAPATLQLLLVGIDLTGFEHSSARSVTVDAIADFKIEPGVPTRIGLGDFELMPGTALAVRGRWELQLLPGEILRAGESFPATGFEVSPCSAGRLAAFLPTDEVEPAELLRYLQGSEFSLPALIERAVRIAPERRAEALDLLTPQLLGAAPLEVERAVPALRWLSGQRDLGGDPLMWQGWLATRRERHLERLEGELETQDLELPGMAGR